MSRISQKTLLANSLAVSRELSGLLEEENDKLKFDIDKLEREKNKEIRNLSEELSKSNWFRGAFVFRVFCWWIKLKRNIWP